MNKREFLNDIIHTDLRELMKKGRKIREDLRDKKVELCSIVSAKTAICSEDCSFCAQSRARSYPLDYKLLSYDEVLSIVNSYEGRVNRVSLVTSGRTLKKEFNEILNYYENLNQEMSLKLCASHGFLSQEQFQALKDSGVKRYHCNLESSERYFPEVCTSHTFQDKVENIKRAQKVGLEICSGGIIGMGESFEDRFDMALVLRDLKVESTPINILLAQKGTKLEGQEILSKEEILRSLLLFRILLPKTSLRIAAGRGLYPDFDKDILDTGVDALMTGDLLTTTGSDLNRDLDLIESLGYERMAYGKN